MAGGGSSMQKESSFAASGALIYGLLFYLPEARGLTGLYARMAGLRTDLGARRCIAP